MDSVETINDAKILFKLETEQTAKDQINLQLLHDVIYGCKLLTYELLGTDFERQRFFNYIKFESDFKKDLGADSLDAVEIMMNCEKRFGITIKDEDAESLVEFGNLVKYIYKELINKVGK